MWGLPSVQMSTRVNECLAMFYLHTLFTLQYYCTCWIPFNKVHYSLYVLLSLCIATIWLKHMPYWAWEMRWVSTDLASHCYTRVLVPCRQQIWWLITVPHAYNICMHQMVSVPVPTGDCKGCCDGRPAVRGVPGRQIWYALGQLCMTTLASTLLLLCSQATLC